MMIEMPEAKTMSCSAVQANANTAASALFEDVESYVIIFIHLRMHQSKMPNLQEDMNSQT